MPRSILIFPEYQLRHIFWLVHGFNALANPEIEVVWANKRLWPSGFGPCEDSPWVKHERIDKALARLDEGGFDAVVFSDGSQLAHLTSHLKRKTTRVYLDSIDPRYLVGPAMRWTDLYLKCQYSKNGPPMVGDEISLEPYAGLAPVIPWPYCTASWIEEEWVQSRPVEPGPHVHFHGWCWPPSRIEAVKTVASAVSVRGGFYFRDDFKIDENTPDEALALIKPRVPFQTFIGEMLSCRAALNVVGNGQMCFRTHEIMRCGVCCVSEKMDAVWPGREPVNGVEWFVCDSPAELAECCRWLMEAPGKCAEVGAAGRQYWEDFCHPRVAARRLVEALGWE